MKRTDVKYCPHCGSELEMKYAEGRDRKVCKECKSIYYINPLPAATSLVLNDKNQLLLGKRGIEPAKGQWCLPGGFVEIDESMEAAALRELKEETGLTGKPLSFVGCTYQKSNFYGGVIIFGYSVEIIQGEMKAGDDMEDLKYYDLDNLPPVAFDAHIYLINQLKLQLMAAS
jgi:ADP-ribose pyrophosphatase YjhB (NUDIX family)